MAPMAQRHRQGARDMTDRPVPHLPPGALPQASALLDRQVTAVTADDIRSAVDRSVREADELDWKVQLYDFRNDGSDEEARKCAEDVAAFANRRGGVIVFGVADRDHAASAPVGVDFDPGFARWVGQIVAGRVFPQVPVHVWEVEDPDLDDRDGYVLLAVMPSPLSPHAIAGTNRDVDLRYRVRRGEDSDWLKEHEVAFEYAARQQRRESRRQRDREMRDAAREIGLLHTSDMASPPRIWLTISTVPDVAGYRPLTEAWYDEVRSDWPRLLDAGPGGRTGVSGQVPSSVEVTTIARAIRVMALNELVTDLHEDGSSFVAFALDVPPAHEKARAFDGSGARVFLLDSMLVSDVARALKIAVEHAAEAGCYGNATITVGLAGSRTQSRAPDTSMVRLRLAGTASPNFGGRIAGDSGAAGHARLHPDPRTSLASTAVPLPDHGDGAALAAAIRRAATPLVQMMGLPMVRQIDPAGRFVRSGFPEAAAGSVATWARQIGAEVAD